MAKEKRIYIKVTDEQHRLLLQKAEQQGMCVTEYMLFCGMNARINCEVGMFMGRELYEIQFAASMLKKNEITQDEFIRIKGGYISKIEKTGGHRADGLTEDEQIQESKDRP